jgi:2-polyprenyl-3-methyl-5-hydroxy-6-metoxy-1,4-benzoquinol methylase
MVDPTRFWNRSAARYARKPVRDEAAYQAKLAWTRRVLGPQMRVLELGCGTGSTALAHAPFVQQIVATDSAEAMIRIARDKAERAGASNVAFAVETAEAPSQPEGGFDAVLAMNLLHLLDEPEEAVRRVFRLLRPGGAFVSTTACLRDFRGPLALVLPVLLPSMRLVGLAPPVRTFGAAELVAWVEGAGFEIEERRPQDAGRALFLIARKPV